MGILNNKPPLYAPPKVSTKKLGDGAEDAALDFLLDKGMQLVARNYRTPGRGGGEIDLIVRAPDGTVVFVEVRKRSTASHGGAAASVSVAKQRRIIFAARHYLMSVRQVPPCRFDVLALEPHGMEWLQGAFDAA